MEEESDLRSRTDKIPDSAKPTESDKVERILDEARLSLTPKTLETYLLMVDAKLQEINSEDSSLVNSEKNPGYQSDLIRYLRRLLRDMQNRH